MDAGRLSFLHSCSIGSGSLHRIHSGNGSIRCVLRDEFSRGDSLSSARSRVAKQVEKVDARTLHSVEFAKRFECASRPVLLTHSIPTLDSDEARNAWIDQWMNQVHEQSVLYQIRKTFQRKARVQLYETSLYDFIQLCATESSHQNAFFHMDENLIPQNLRSPFVLPSWLLLEDDQDWFAHFPHQVRPPCAGACAFLGGHGARSSLHRDPYDWTGLNYGLEGRKVWTFMRATTPESAKIFHQKLNAYRQPPVAWDSEGEYGLGAGWESEVDLYWDYDDERNAVKVRRTRHTQKNDMSDCGEVEVLECVQESGDLIVIPGGWWHQTYYLEASMSVAGQIMTRSGCELVLKHILEYSNAAHPSAEDRIHQLFQCFDRKTSDGRQRIIDNVIMDAILSRNDRPRALQLLHQLNIHPNAYVSPSSQSKSS